MSVYNALALAWRARQRLWQREPNGKGQPLGKLRDLSREEMDALLSAVIYAIEEERTEANTDQLFDLLEEHGLLEKADKKLNRF